jgi:hypothetical protein
MTANEKFYRLHDNDQAPAFSADNAWSGLWGADFSEGGSRSRCPECEGTGESYGEKCRSCDGEGWHECQLGYSCCDSAEALLEYFADTEDDAKVVVFAGERIGTGFDGEPLAVPTSEIRWTTLGQLRAELT